MCNMKLPKFKGKLEIEIRTSFLCLLLDLEMKAAIEQGRLLNEICTMKCFAELLLIYLDVHMYISNKA